MHSSLLYSPHLVDNVMWRDVNTVKMCPLHICKMSVCPSNGCDGNFGSLYPEVNPSADPRLLNNQWNMQIELFFFWYFLCFACSHFPRVVLSATSHCDAQCVGQRDMEGGGRAPKRLRGDDLMDTWWATKHRARLTFYQGVSMSLVWDTWIFEYSAISDNFWLIWTPLTTKASDLKTSCVL